MTEQASAPQEKPIGKVTHYFSKIGVMAVDLTDKLSVGERIHVRGHTTDLILTVDSLQIEHANVSEAKPGDSVGIKVSEKVRPGDTVYRAQ